MARRGRRINRPIVLTGIHCKGLSSLSSVATSGGKKKYHTWMPFHPQVLLRLFDQVDSTRRISHILGALIWTFTLRATSACRNILPRCALSCQYSRLYIINIPRATGTASSPRMMPRIHRSGGDEDAIVRMEGVFNVCVSVKADDSGRERKKNSRTRPMTFGIWSDSSVITRASYSAIQSQPRCSDGAICARKPETRIQSQLPFRD